MTDDTFDLNDLVSSQTNDDTAPLPKEDEQILHTAGVDMLGGLSDDKNDVIKSQKIIESKIEPKNLDSESLSDAFQATFSSGNTNNAVGQADFSDERAGLEALEKKIGDKLLQKRKEVEARLDSLKKEKEAIGKEIEIIKELEKIEDKIRAKEEALGVLADEIDKIEVEAEKDLKSL